MAAKTRILVLGMGTTCFGLERQTVAVLKQMQQVVPFFLISKYEDGSVSELLEREGFAYAHLPFGYLGRKRLAWSLVTLVQMPWLWLQIVYACLRHRCGAVLVLNLHPVLNASVPILFLRFVYGASVVFYFHNDLSYALLRRTLAWLVRASASRIVAVSESVRRRLAAWGIPRQRVTTVLNGIDCARFQNRTGSPWRERLGVGEDQILVGYAGQCTEKKGLEDFVRAARLVIDRNPKCRFVIVGRLNDTDAFHRRIRALIQETGLAGYIALTGWVEEIEDVYSAMDMAVVPSQHDEPFGLVNVEAMASAVPVIATRVGGIPEIILDGHSGLLVEASQPAQIAERILLLAQETPLRKSIGLAGRERVSRLFNLRTNASQMEDILLSA